MESETHTEFEDPQNLKPPSLPHWLAICIQPRATINYIIRTDAEKNLFLLGALAGIARALDNAAGQATGESLSLGGVLAISLIMGPIGGILSIIIGGALYKWSGSWFGGTASAKEVRAAIGWSYIPTILILVTWIPIIATSGGDVFAESSPTLESSIFAVIVLMIMVVIQFIGGIWSIILFVITLSEVHKIKIWQSILAGIGGFLIIVAPIVLGILLFTSATG